MMNLKEMTINELRDYEKRLSLHNEKTSAISKMAHDFFASYGSKSCRENADTITAFEVALDSYEKEAKELDFETPFVEAHRGLIPAMKILAGIN